MYFLYVFRKTYQSCFLYITSQDALNANSNEQLSFNIPNCEHTPINNVYYTFTIGLIFIY